MNFKISILLVFAFSPILWGQIDSNVPVTLDDYINLAAANNAELKAECQKWQGTIEQIPQAKSLADPTISYGYATDETPQRSEFEVMQMFPWFGVIQARTDVANAMAKSTGRQYEAKKLAVLYELKEAFYEYSFLARATEITNENLKLTRHFEEVARSKYAISTTSQPDVIRPGRACYIGR